MVLKVKWALWFIFGFSVLASKSGVHLSALLLSLFCIWDLYVQKKLKNPFILWGVALFPLGIILSLLSLGGYQSALNFISASPWPLMVPVGFVLASYFSDKNSSHLKALSWGLVIGLIGGALYSTVTHQLWSKSLGEMFATRIDGPWDISRWGLFMAFALLLIWMRWMHTKQWIYLALAPLALFFMLLSQTRTSWVAFALAMGFYAFKSKKVFIKSLVLAGFVTALVMALPQTRKMALSIIDIKKDPQTQTLSASNASNLGRLNMWKVATDALPEVLWFGTGFGNSAPYLKEFIQTQPQEYQNRFTKIEFSLNDQHSSYLNILFQMGLIYSLIFWGFVVTVLYKFIRLRPSYFLKFELLALAVFFLFSFIPTGGVASYEGLVFWTCMGMMVYGVLYPSSPGPIKSV